MMVKDSKTGRDPSSNWQLNETPHLEFGQGARPGRPSINLSPGADRCRFGSGAFAALLDETEHQARGPAGPSLSVVLDTSTQVFGCLLSESDPRLAASCLVRLIGSAVSASRCYWLERHLDEGGCAAFVVSAEWCAQGVSPSGGTRRGVRVSAAAFPPVSEPPPADGMFAVYPDELQQDQRGWFESAGARAVLLAPLHVGGELVGFLGFENCRESRAWTTNEKLLISLACCAFTLAMERHRGIRQRDELAAVIEQSHQAVVLADLSGAIRYANPAFVRLVGGTFGHIEELERRFEHDSGTSGALAPLVQRAAAGHVGESTLRFAVSGQKSKDLEARAFPLRDGAGVIVRICLTLDDISPRLELERQLHRAQKMEALGQFASGIAHDFNNLIMVITSGTELIRRRLTVDDPLHDDLATIFSAAHRAGELTRSLLAFSRRQVLQRRVLEINAVVGSMLPLLRRVLPETIRLEYRPAADAGLVFADLSQLEQVIVNLCVNARDAMPDGGVLSIATGRSRVGEKTADRPWAVPGEYVWIKVQDNGVGMDEETRSRVFEPFFSTKEPGYGTGLGLSTVYGIVKQHQGFIEIETRLHEGSAFTVHLPSTSALPSPPTYPTPAATGRAVSGHEHLLVVEDNDELRSLLARLLADHGYRVSEAPNGSVALEVFNRHPDIALVIADLVMPEMGGLELYRRIAHRSPPPAFIFSTGYAAETGTEELPQGHRISYLTKPYATEVLLQRVRALLDTPGCGELASSSSSNEKSTDDH